MRADDMVKRLHQRLDHTGSRNVRLENLIEVERATLFTLRRDLAAARRSGAQLERTLRSRNAEMSALRQHVANATEGEAQLKRSLEISKAHTKLLSQRIRATVRSQASVGTQIHHCEVAIGATPQQECSLRAEFPALYATEGLQREGSGIVPSFN